MKLYCQLLALYLIHANVCGSAAFSIARPAASRQSVATALRSSPYGTMSSEPGIWLSTDEIKPDPPSLQGSSGLVLPSSQDSSSLAYFLSPEQTWSPKNQGMNMFPNYPGLDLLQGGGTVNTYQMPAYAERCQYILATDGRPLRAKVELWLGPLRTTHTLNIDVEDGRKTPVQATLKFKKASQVLKISTTDTVDFPVLAGVFVPSVERSKELGDNTEKVWKECPPEEKKKLQGGTIEGGRGALRYWIIPPNVESIQVLAWSKETGKKSFKGTIEILQGPDSVKQEYMLQCGGGSQPYHGVFQTPGEGCAVLIRNKKFIEDGLTKFAVLPYTYKN